MSNRPPSREGADRSARSGTPRVRPARLHEADLLIDFQAQLARESEGVELDLDTLGRGVRAVFDDPTLGEYWVVELDRRVAGCLLATREWSDWHNGTVLWVQSVYVLPDARGRGLYRALHEHLRRRVEAAPDLVGIRLIVDQRNRDAQAVYQRLGMTGDHYALYEWLK
jgi:GNAT superfamily N-acetyltransferase